MLHIPNLAELLVIFFVVMLLFGANKLPEIGRGLGEGIKNFKEAVSSDKKEKEVSAKEVN